MQVGDDAVERTIGEADADVACPRLGIACDLDQHAGVMGGKRPGGKSVLGCVHCAFRTI
ncbi:MULTISPECIES: hypothetical protein [unclassified Nonomuraea]|uniref:hypothetical protein n=1 Tax=unclassified Nonomuraea TaxID=2593643 RepID=UPI0013788090|nr:MULTISPECIES: hypothetical protein [unclassified Nonomuraea]NBE98816.1 hypothetical protein [Nonomuraea sp. K271]